MSQTQREKAQHQKKTSGWKKKKKKKVGAEMQKRVGTLPWGIFKKGKYIGK
jgi:hypothetical protein